MATDHTVMGADVAASAALRARVGSRQLPRSEALFVHAVFGVFYRVARGPSFPPAYSPMSQARSTPWCRN